MRAEDHRQFIFEVQQEIDLLNERLRQLEAVADYHRSKIDGERALVASNGNGHHLSGDDGKASLAARLAGKNQREAAAIIIEDFGKPMRVPEIARALVQCGY